MSFAPTTSSCTRRQQLSPQHAHQSSARNIAFSSPEHNEEDDEEFIAVSSLVNMNGVKIKQEYLEEFVEESSDNVNSMDTTSSIRWKGKLFSKLPLHQTTPNGIDTVSLHNHKICQCSVCLYKLASETMLLAKESEIKSLKTIIRNKERIECARGVESNNNHQNISQLEKAIKDKSKQLNLLELDKREQANQLNSEIDRLRGDNQAMEQSYQANINEIKAQFDDLADENENLKQSLGSERVKLQQSNGNCDLLERTNHAFQQQLAALQQSHGLLTEDIANLKLKLQEEMYKVKQSNKEMKQTKQSCQQREVQLKSLVDPLIDENKQLKQQLETALANKQISENELSHCKAEYDQLNGLLIRTQHTTDGLIVQHQQQIDLVNGQIKEMFNECRQQAIKQDFADQPKTDQSLAASIKIETNLEPSPIEKPILVNDAERSIDHLVGVPADGKEMKKLKDEHVRERVLRSSLPSAKSTSISSNSSSSSPMKRKSTNRNVDQAPKRIKNSHDLNDCSKLLIHFKYVKCYSEDCPYKFNSIAKLNQHFIAAHGLLPYRCFANDCDFRCQDSNQLLEHVNSQHSNQTKFTCPIVGCAAQLDHQCADYKHWNYYHLRGDFRCGQCDFVGAFSKSVHDHQKYEHSQLINSGSGIDVPNVVVVKKATRKSR